MKKIVFTIALFAIAGTATIQAQDIPQRKNDGIHQKRGMERKNMMKDLNLTAEQQNKMKALNEEGRKQMEIIRNDDKLTQEQKREKMKAFHETQQAKRIAILTPEQKAKAEAYRNEMQNKRMDGKGKEGMRNGDMKKRNEWGKDRNGLSKAGDHREWMKDLNLTDAQKKKLKVVRENRRSQMQSIRDDNTLTKEQKKAKMQTFMKDQKAKRDAILTPEQRAKWDAHAKEARKRQRPMES